jgi:DNA-binding response OmpR family regulator
MKEVVVIEDEQDIADLIMLHLADLGCRCTHFINGIDGLQHARSEAFDLLILDINLPGMNGFDICKTLREAQIKQPIVMLTARNDESDKIDGLEIGADDYITKPFSIREFIARIKAVFRRMEIDAQSQRRPMHSVKFKDLFIQAQTRLVTLNNERLELTKREFDLLYLLATHPGVTFTRKELLSKVWGDEYSGYEHTVNTHINRLRNKLELDPNDPQYIVTTWGIGYRFNDL